MADADRRRQERGPPGDVQARAALLTSRLRAGELDVQRIVLGAYLGDAAALVVASSAGSQIAPAPDGREGDPFQASEDLDELAVALASWGHETAARAAIAAVWLALPVWDVEHGDAALEQVARAACAWVLEPGDDTLGRLEGAGAALPGAREDVQSVVEDLFGFDPPPAHALAEAGRDLVSLVTLGPPNAAVYARRVLGSVASATRAAAVHAAIRRELLPWALDGEDPLPDRLG